MGKRGWRCVRGVGHDRGGRATAPHEGLRPCCPAPRAASRMPPFVHVGAGCSHCQAVQALPRATPNGRAATTARSRVLWLLYISAQTWLHRLVTLT